VRQPIAKEDLEYVRLFVTTLLAILLVPLAIAHLVMNPHDAAGKAIGGAVK
jgi:hypothetical protein